MIVTYDRNSRAKKNYTEISWFVYLVLMTSFAFPRTQQVYTIILFALTILFMFISNKTRICFGDYRGTVWFGIFALYVNVSRVWSVYDYNYTGITNWVVFILIALACLDYSFAKDNWKFWLVLVDAGFIFSIIVLITSPLSTYTTDMFSGITGQYRNWIGELSAVLCCVNAFIYRYFSKSRKYLMYLILNIAVIFASGARGALLQLILGGSYFIALEKKIQKKILYVVLGIFAVIISIIIIFRNSSLYYAFVERVLGAIRNDGTTYSIVERQYFIESAWKLFLKHPILGCGVDSMRGYLTSVGYWHVTYCHCMYLELLSSYGLIGTFLFFLPTIEILLDQNKSKLTRFLLPVILIGFLWCVEYYSFVFIFLLERLQCNTEQVVIQKT